MPIDRKENIPHEEIEGKNKDKKKEEVIEEEEVQPEDQKVEGKEPENEEAKKAKRLLAIEKLRVIWKDPVTREAFWAIVRTFVNVGISVADAFPGLTEAFSWGADLIKIVKTIRKKHVEAKKKQKDSGDDAVLNLFSKLDPSPDVGVGIATSTEVLEVFTGTAFPSHIVETTLQLGHDFPRIIEGFKRLKEIMGVETIEELRKLANEELEDYQQHQGEIDEAITKFKQQG